MKKTAYSFVLTLVVSVAMTLVVAVELQQSRSQISYLAKANIDVLAESAETSFGDAIYYVTYPTCAINVPAGSVVSIPGLPPYTAEYDMFISLTHVFCMSGGQSECHATTCEEELGKQGITIN